MMDIISNHKTYVQYKFLTVLNNKEIDVYYVITDIMLTLNTIDVN